ncbi:MAG: cbb3-type cytochrome c oxidase subunit I [Chloroflexi bacterium]|nr:cbb3-type cytochrome c oxidase subunit I [Chloroflexota bacterium]
MAALAEDVKYRSADSVALKFVVGSALGLIVVVLLGFIMSLQMTNFGAGFSMFFLNLRGLHLQAVIFAWLSMALMGAMYYAVPRICGRDLFSKTLGNLHFVLQWVGIVLVVITLLLGFSEGREYLEPILPIDVAVVVIWLIFVGNILGTVLTSGAKKIPYSALFITASILYLGVNYLVGMIPLRGLPDAIAVWTFAHNEVNGWFMVGLMGLMYYALPKLTGLEDDPPYNTKLTPIHFWSLMVFIPPSVLHHLLYKVIPVSEFWKEVGQWTSVGMLVPTVIWTYIVYSYIRNSRKGFTLPLKFMAVTMGFYFLNCLQGAVQSIRAINDITHGSQWTIGHAHLALFGWISIGTFGILYFLLPRLTGRDIRSEGAANAQLWLAAIGLLLMWGALSIGGLIQGSLLASGQGYYAAREALQPFFLVRILGGIAIASASILFLYNVVAAVRQPAEERVSGRAAIGQQRI